MDPETLSGRSRFASIGVNLCISFLSERVNARRRWVAEQRECAGSASVSYTRRLHRGAMNVRVH